MHQILKFYMVYSVLSIIFFCAYHILILFSGFSYRSCDALRSNPLLLKLIPAACVIAFAAWGIGPLMRLGRILFLHVLILI